MAANKQIIFDIGNKAPEPPVLAQQQQQQQQQPVILPNTQPLASGRKIRPKSSNLGVRVSMKQITKSPVPVVLPSTQPNQPVVALGQLIQAPVVIGNPQESFNPATKHPAVMNNNPPIINTTTYIPEQTHPAILPAPIKSVAKLPAAQPITHMPKTNKENTNKPKTKKTKTKKTLKQTRKQTKAPATQLPKKKTNRVFGI